MSLTMTKFGVVAGAGLFLTACASTTTTEFKKQWLEKRITDCTNSFGEATQGYRNCLDGHGISERDAQIITNNRSSGRTPTNQGEISDPARLGELGFGLPSGQELQATAGSGNLKGSQISNEYVSPEILAQRQAIENQRAAELAKAEAENNKRIAFMRAQVVKYEASLAYYEKVTKNNENILFAEHVDLSNFEYTQYDPENAGCYTYGGNVAGGVQMMLVSKAFGEKPIVLFPPAYIGPHGLVESMQNDNDMIPIFGSGDLILKADKDTCEVAVISTQTDFNGVTSEYIGEIHSYQLDQPFSNGSWIRKVFNEFDWGKDNWIAPKAAPIPEVPTFENPNGSQFEPQDNRFDNSMQFPNNGQFQNNGLRP